VYQKNKNSIYPSRSPLFFSLRLSRQRQVLLLIAVLLSSFATSSNQNTHLTSNVAGKKILFVSIFACFWQEHLGVFISVRCCCTAEISLQLAPQSRCTARLADLISSDLGNLFQNSGFYFFQHFGSFLGLACLACKDIRTDITGRRIANQYRAHQGRLAAHAHTKHAVGTREAG